MTRNALRLPALAVLIFSIAACNAVEANSSLAVFEGVAARVRKDCDQAGAKPVMGITTMKIPGAVVVTLSNDLCNG
jgi:hypothetical protein